MTSTSMTSARGEDIIILEKVLYIYYLVQFQKRAKKVSKALVNYNSKVNAMTIV